LFLWIFCCDVFSTSILFDTNVVLPTKSAGVISSLDEGKLSIFSMVGSIAYIDPALETLFFFLKMYIQTFDHPPSSLTESEMMESMSCF
jgi:hypothetical protein